MDGGAGTCAHDDELACSLDAHHRSIEAWSGAIQIAESALACADQKRGGGNEDVQMLRALGLLEPINRLRDLESLKQLVIRMCAWGWSTSGVERIFSMAHCASRLTRADLSDELADDEVQILSCDGDDLEIAAAARDVWGQRCGVTRRTHHRRADAGKKHTWQETGLTTETDWVKRRRAETTAASIASGVASSAAFMPEERIVGVDFWTERHEQAMRNQEAKQERATVEAYEEGVLLADETTPRVEQLWHEEQLAESRRDREYWADRKRKDAALSGPARVHFSGKLVYLDVGVLRCAIGGQPAATEKGFAFVDDGTSLGADIVVCKDPLAPSSPEIVWSLALLGGYYCNALWVQSDCERGIALHYRPACRAKKRIVYCSHLFLSNHPELAQAVSYACEVPSSMWSRFSRGGQYEFLQTAGMRTHAGNCSAFLVQTEIASAEFAHVHHKFTADTAMNSLLEGERRSSFG